MSVILLFAACGETAGDVDAVSAAVVGTRPPLDAQLIERGRPLYDTWCASCHGLAGEGQADWMTPRADGSFRPPPHDATGHTWHHSDAHLLDLIANGSDFARTRMPSFGERLGDAEIMAVLEYIKTWWGHEELDHQWRVSQQGR